MSKRGNSKGWTFDTLAIAGILLVGGVVVWVQTLTSERDKANTVALVEMKQHAGDHNGVFDKIMALIGGLVSRKELFGWLLAAIAAAGLIAQWVK